MHRNRHECIGIIIVQGHRDWANGGTTMSPTQILMPIFRFWGLGDEFHPIFHRAQFKLTPSKLVAAPRQSTKELTIDSDRSPTKTHIECAPSKCTHCRIAQRKSHRRQHCTCNVTLYSHIFRPIKCIQYEWIFMIIYNNISMLCETVITHQHIKWLVWHLSVAIVFVQWQHAGRRGRWR